jgi:phage N-6-adenine-methyltransferase
MKEISIIDQTNTLAIYDPGKGLLEIAAADVALKYWRKAWQKSNDPLAREQLEKAVETKIDEQVDYILWRDGIVQHGGDRKSKSRLQRSNLDPLPDADPGDVTAHRWRTKFFSKPDKKSDWVPDPGKIAYAKHDAKLRSVRICEQTKDHAVRGAEGTGENEWFTPEEYIELARVALGGEIDLDPASHDEAQRVVLATRFFTKADDGLAHEWHGRVYLNPPYAQPLIAQFVDKLVEERIAGRVSAAIMLTHNYTDAGWFETAASVADAIGFTRGRVKFYNPNKVAAPTQGQAFFYFGDDVARFTEVFKDVCHFLFPPLPPQRIEGLLDQLSADELHELIARAKQRLNQPGEVAVGGPAPDDGLDIPGFLRRGAP